MTRKTLCELIQRRLAGGDVSDDFSPKLDEINLWLNHGIAASAFKNYTDSVQIDGIEFVSESFYITLGGLTINKDENTGWYFANLPSSPYALPKGYDITMVAIQGNGKLSKGLVRKDAVKHNAHDSLPKPPNKIFWWVDSKALWMDSFTPIQSNTLTLRMAASAGGVYQGGISDELRVPDDAIPYVIEYVLKVFGQPAIQDTSNDGINRV